MRAPRSPPSLDLGRRAGLAGSHTDLMVKRAAGALTLLTLVALSACGGGSSTSTTSTVAGDANPADVNVIDGWVTALRHGDVDAASKYFAIPSVAENGPVLVRIRSLDDARHFNESLPCGAELIRADSAGEFTTATFRLTERPGPGVCGPGTGGVAKTSFVIRDGKIAQWRRVGAGAAARPLPTARSSPCVRTAQVPTAVRTRAITSFVNSVVPACPPRSGVRTPAAVAPSTAS